MCLLPNAGSLGLAVSAAMMFGLIALMFLDTSINMAMQPFKMLVGDMVNEEQKAKAYSIQSFLCNAGSVVGFLFPFFFTYIGIKNVAEKGVVPDSVIWSFYIGAAILILCVIYTTLKVKEWNPQEYAEYNAVAESKEEKEDSANWLTLLRKAPSTFWKVGLVQFFCWAAFLYMWNYSTGAIAETVWNTTDPASEAFQAAGNWVGVLFAVQAIGSVIWAAVLPQFKNTKAAYAFSLILGGIGFAIVPFIHDAYLQFIPFLLIGCAWAAMLAMPFTFVTNALQGYGHMGAYLGLFNGTICIPQIVAALCGGLVLSLIGSHQSSMMLVAAVLLVVGAACVTVIRDKK
jgi:maltose/moltooligosaccharide transporter